MIKLVPQEVAEFEALNRDYPSPNGKIPPRFISPQSIHKGEIYRTFMEIIWMPAIESWKKNGGAI